MLSSLSLAPLLMHERMRLEWECKVSYGRYGKCKKSTIFWTTHGKYVSESALLTMFLFLRSPEEKKNSTVLWHRQTQRRMKEQKMIPAVLFSLLTADRQSSKHPGKRQCACACAWSRMFRNKVGVEWTVGACTRRDARRSPY